MDALAARWACKAAVKAGQKLSDQEIGQLLTEGMAQGSLKHCPHGRPATLRLSLQDLDRQFGRT